MKCPICSNDYPNEKMMEHLQEQHKSEDVISKLIDLSEAKNRSPFVATIKALNQYKKPVAIRRKRFF